LCFCCAPDKMCTTNFGTHDEEQFLVASMSSIAKFF
jgi:hypothetical protein